MSKDRFIKNWLEGKLSDEDIIRKGKQYFRSKEEIINLQNILGALQEWEIPGDKVENTGWDRLFANLNADEQKPINIDTNPGRKSIQWIYSTTAIAATITIFIFAYLIFYINKPVKINTAIGELETVLLPDGSLISLNANSELSYDPTRWEEERTVHLTGEAFFEIEKGPKFVVKNPVADVEVLGTSFNIKARDEVYEVACYTGKVVVSNERDGALTQLSKGMAVSIGAQGSTGSYKFNLEKISAWQIGEFHFESQPLASVFEEFKRQYDVTLILQSDISGRLYSGFFTKGEMDKALELICLPMNLTYKIDDNKIIIY